MPLPRLRPPAAGVADCVKLTPETSGPFLAAPTCAYRAASEGKDLPDWHPLVSGAPAPSTRRGSRRAAGCPAFEEDVAVDDLPEFIVSGPANGPRRRRGPEIA